MATSMSRPRVTASWNTNVGEHHSVDSAGSIELQHSTSFNERTCWVCFAVEEDEPGKEWTCPCKCRGATKWVHQDCLQPWIDQKQRGSSSIEVACPQCQHPYNIVYPNSSPLLYLYEYGNRAITFLSPVVLASLTASSLYWVSFTFGVTSASLALGKERSIDFFSKPESSLIVVALPILPWVILGVKLLRPEVITVRMWYNMVLPTLHMIKNVAKPHTSSESHVQHKFVPAPVPVVPFLTRSIVSTFLLPLYSSAIGWGLSYVMRSTGTLKRTLLGALCYFLASYAIKMCLELHRGQFQRVRS